MVIYMDDYRKARKTSCVEMGGYDEELLCVNWNPAVRVFAMSCYQTPQELSPQLPDDFESREEVSAFVHRISALASQI